jgi:UDP-glucose 4-epimerase
MTEPFILITGGAGYIGSYTALLFVRQGYSCILLDEQFRHGQYAWAVNVQGDYADQQLLAKIFKQYPIDAVIHCAAIDTQLHGKNSVDHYQKDLSKTITLLKSMVEHGIKKSVFASSAHVYGKHEGILTVDLKKYPHTTYGKSKSLIEDLLADFNHTYGLCSASMRYFGVCGYLHNQVLAQKASTNIIRMLIESAKKNSPFLHGDIYNTPDGSLIRDFIHVWDIAHANLKAYNYLQHNAVADCFNVGSGNGVSIKQLIHEAQKIFDTKIKVIAAKETAAEPAVVVADISKTVDLLRWQPSHSNIEFILKSTYAGM